MEMAKFTFLRIPYFTTFLLCFFSSLFLSAQESSGTKTKQTSSSVNKENLDLYLLIGQSNMAGRGPLDTLETEPDPRILMLDSTDQWVPAKDPMHFDKPIAGVGPGISFAKAMLAGQPHQKIGLIPCAWGGSPIRVWQPGAKYFDNYPYDEAIERAIVAMEKGELKGILWHQGESDNDPEKAAVYLEKLKTLVKNLRSDLNAPNLPFVLGEIGYFNREDHINPVIRQVPGEIPHTAVVSAAGLKDKGDHLHFATPFAQELGRRYAAAMKRMQKKQKQTFRSAHL